MQKEPVTISSLLAAAQARYRAGGPAAALACCEAALHQAPDHLEVLKAVGSLALESGQTARAIAVFRRMTRLPDAGADCHFALGVALEADGKSSHSTPASHASPASDATNSSAPVVADPASAAEAAYAAALTIDPGHFGARLNRCALLLGRQDFAAAEAEGRRLTERHPERAEAWSNLAQALFANVRYGEADAALATALTIAPEHWPARFARVVGRAMLGDIAGALDRLDELRRQGFSAPQIAGIAGAPELWNATRDDLEDIHLTALFESFRCGDWACLAPLRAGLAALAAEVRAGRRLRVRPIQAFQAMALGVDHADYLSLVRQVSAGVGPAVSLPPLSLPTSSLPTFPLPTSALPPTAAPTEGRRLRIGYLSPAFRDHPGAYLFRRLFAAHHRDCCEVYAYSLGADDGSPVRQEIVAGCDRFIDLANCTDAEAAQRIRADGIDLLVELEGYLDGTRPAILAARPAPLQLSYAGLLGIVEAPFIDYRLADRRTDGDFAGQAGQHEQPAYLAGCFLPYGCPEAPWTLAATRREHGLPEGATVFCAFHNDYKLTPESFAAWMAILDAVPGSVLWLIAGSDRHFAALGEHAEQLGVAADRLIRAGRLPNDQHLARLRLADLYLDSFSCNGHTSVLDALWMGLPVLTRRGHTPASRLAASALAELGLDELALPDTASYVASAIELAGAPARLAAVRQRLATARRQAVLFDPDRQAAQLEAAYRRMWSRHCAGLPPAVLDIDPRPERAR